MQSFLCLVRRTINMNLATIHGSDYPGSPFNDPVTQLCCSISSLYLTGSAAVILTVSQIDYKGNVMKLKWNEIHKKRSPKKATKWFLCQKPKASWLCELDKNHATAGYVSSIKEETFFFLRQSFADAFLHKFSTKPVKTPEALSNLPALQISQNAFP